MDIKNTSAESDLGPQTAASVWQLVNSFVPFFALLYLMFLAFSVSYWIVLGLAVLAAGFMVRIFILQHDCGHGSFFRSRKANNRVGLLCSLVTMVPYYYWRRQHNLHHASSGNLDRRGYGDMNLLTVAEYSNMNRWERFKYRFYRHPLVFLFLGPLALHLINNRYAPDKRQSSAHDRRNVYWTDLTLVIIFFAVGWWIGYVKLLLIFGPVVYLAGAAGIWLFYVQHQFEFTYWRRESAWDPTQAAMEGSSLFKLPGLPRWFTGNIGYHHLHHLKDTIPNYRLRKCYEETPAYHNVHIVTLRSSFRAMFLSLWDEEQQRLISFRELAARRG